MKSFFPLILLLFAANISMRAQTTGTLSGRVMDGQNKPIAGAMIIILGTSPLRGAIAKNDGSFNLGRIQVGRYGVRIKAVGYRGRVDSVRIEADRETRWDFTLAPAEIDTTRVRTPEEGMRERLRDQNIQRRSTVNDPRSMLAPNADQRRSKPGPSVIGRPGKHSSITDTYSNIQQAIARTRGIHMVGQECIFLRLARITYVPYRMPEEGWRRLTGGNKTASMQSEASHPAPGAMGFTIRGTRGETNIRVDGIEISDPFQDGSGATTAVYYPAYSIVSPPKSPGTGGFEPEFGDVVDIRPEEIGTNAITPSEYYRVTGGNPYNVADSPLTSLMQSLNDPFSADGRFHRRGSFPRRRSSIFH